MYRQEGPGQPLRNNCLQTPWALCALYHHEDLGGKHGLQASGLALEGITIGAGIKKAPATVSQGPEAPDAVALEDCHGQNTSSLPLLLMLTTRSQSKERQAP